MHRGFSRLIQMVCAVLLIAVPAAPTTRAQEISPDEARNIALLLAEQEQIDVKSPDLIVDTLDANGAFVHGYYSFILIHQDPHTPGADRTLGMFAINARNGDAWELNLCKHYTFAKLEKMQKRIRHSTGAKRPDELEAQRSVGCVEHAAAAAGNGS